MGLLEVRTGGQQQRVAAAQHDIADPSAEAAAAAMHGDDRCVIHRPEVRVADVLADQGRGARDHRLGQPAVVAARPDEIASLRIGRGHARDPLQVHDRIDHAGERQFVLRLQDLVGPDRRDDPFVADDLDEEQAGEVAKAGLLNGLADQAAVRLNAHVDQVLARTFAELLEQILAIGQQPPPHQQQVDHADHGHRHADPRRLKERDRSQSRRSLHTIQPPPLREDQTVDHQVCARADQRAHAAQDRQVRDGDQQPRRRDPKLATPISHHRHQHRHHRCIVQERRRTDHKRRHPQQRPAFAPGRTEHPRSHHIESPRFPQSGRHHEQGPHRQHPFIGESREQFGRRDDARQRGQHRPTQQDDVRRAQALGQGYEHQHHHRQGVPALPLHTDLARLTRVGLAGPQKLIGLGTLLGAEYLVFPIDPQRLFQMAVRLLRLAELRADPGQLKQ